MQSQVRFNSVPEKVPEKVWEVGAEPGQVQQRSREGSGEVLRGFGAEPGQVQQRSREGSGEVLGGWCRARSGSTAFQRRFRRSSGRLKEVPEKVLEKVPEGLGAARFNEASRCDCGSVSA